MSFGSTQGVRKKQEIGSQTTVDLMMNSGIIKTIIYFYSDYLLIINLGLKYVHATNKGRGGMEGDLEKSRKLLMEKGFIDKDNFDDDPDSKFNNEEFRKMVN